MVLKIRSRDKEAKLLIEELVALLTDNGAYFNPKLQLDVQGSELSYSCKGPLDEQAKLITLPFQCMPILEDFVWSLDANKDLRWELAKSPQAVEIELHQQIVDRLVHLYNRLGKLTDYGKQSPIVQFANKSPLVDRLLEFAHEHLLQAKLNEGSDQLLIYAFWYGRIFSDYQTQRTHLIPLMEFFNHSIFAESFFQSSDVHGERTLNLSSGSSDNTKGVFARYEIMDNLHAFVKYGFVDDRAFFVQSQPFEIDLLGGVVRLQIGYQAASGNQCQLHEWSPVPAYSNSLMYRSRLRFLTDCVFVPYMMVPPERHLPAFDDALKAQLIEIEQVKSLSQGELANASIMGEIKKALLKANESAYRSIAKAGKEAQLDKGAPLTRLLKKMLKHQGQILAEFRNSQS